jgi:hypothetical protein
MLATKQASSAAFLITAAALASLASGTKQFGLVSWVLTSGAGPAENDILWTGTGGGWRAMVAQSAYAQVFFKLGILNNSPASKKTPKIKLIDGSSGSSWFTTQFAFSQNYYNAVVRGTPASLGRFTQEWMDAYATTQAMAPADCGQYQDLCEKIAVFDPDLANAIEVALYYNRSWPEVVYAMFNATSASVYNDPSMVSVKASSQNKLAALNGVDVCFHTSLLPNARARDANTITYLAEDYTNVSSSFTVPLPRDYCVGDRNAGWYPDSFPGGNVYNLNQNASFTHSSVVKGFPMFPPKASDGLYVTPEHDTDTNTAVVSLSPQQMSLPFGNDPTALQISVASSSTVAYMSEELASFFSQYFSVTDYGIRQSSSLTEEQILEIIAALDKLQNELWSTGLLANAATMSGWVDPNPITMPPALKTNYWFADGAFTDGPAAAQAIARYQKSYGRFNHIKLIICNQNYWTNNNNNILDYFNYSGNEGKDPGEFLWPMGVGSGPQTNPQMSKQIFGGEMTADMLSGLMEPVNGTNLTMAVLPVFTTVDNGEL